MTDAHDHCDATDPHNLKRFLDSQEQIYGQALTEVRDEVRAALRLSRLQVEIDRWTSQLRARANVDVYAWR